MIGTSLEEIEAAALQLASSDRAHLTERLLASLDPDDKRCSNALDRGAFCGEGSRACHFLLAPTQRSAVQAPKTGRWISADSPYSIKVTDVVVCSGEADDGFFLVKWEFVGDGENLGDFEFDPDEWEQLVAVNALLPA